MNLPFYLFESRQKRKSEATLKPKGVADWVGIAVGDPKILTFCDFGRYGAL
jgi:hypothetical protein